MTATNRSGPISASESGSNALLSWARLEWSVDTRFDMRSITLPLDVRRPSGAERSASRTPS